MNSSDLHVVGIGASAGGLKALQDFFEAIPVNTGLAFVVIQHLSSDFKSMMPELLAKHTSMPIQTASNDQQLLPNHVYLNDSESNLELSNGRFKKIEIAKNGLHLPIDIFFKSLALEYGSDSIGVILSGTGTDGSRGVVNVKEAGGTTFVQDPQDAQFDGMPKSSIASKKIDFVLRSKDIANKVAELSQHKLIFQKKWMDKESDESNFLKILKLIDNLYNVDFSEYKRNTLVRRIEKRISFLNLHNLEEYLTYLKQNHEEVGKLKQDLLIGVTSFFRDSEAFESLANLVLPRLVNSERMETIRVWVAGCSTGEEAYSLAMLLDSYIVSTKHLVDFKIFATDIDQEAINIASAGEYHANAVQEIPTQYLERYFTTSGATLKINKRIREKIIFSRHNILKDPPFLKTDMVSCRNVMIYLDQSSQKKALKSFNFSLAYRGVLFLGTSESLGDYSDIMTPLDAANKIFENSEERKKIETHANVELRLPNKTNFDTILSRKSVGTNVINPEDQFDYFLGQMFAPSCIFIDSKYNVLYLKGNVAERLKMSSGVFQSNLFKMLPPNVNSMIRSGLRALDQNKQNVFIKGVKAESDQVDLVFDLEIMDSSEYIPNSYLIVFHENREATKDEIVISSLDLPNAAERQISDLEFELNKTKQQLSDAVEQLEASNEELQSSNEELMASNEELQSTNEELQSVNEELYTVNFELQEKNRELVEITDEADNLLKSTDIGTLFLDLDLRIRKFTPSITKHFDLKEHDKGRLLQNFSANFMETSYNKLLNDCRKCITDPGTYEDEVINVDKDVFYRQVRPFIASSKMIEGVVVTFVNVSELRKAEARIESTEKKFESLFSYISEGIFHGKVLGNSLLRKGNVVIDGANPKLNSILKSNGEISLKDFNSFSLGSKFKNWEELLTKVASGKVKDVEVEAEFQGRDYLVKICQGAKNEFVGILTDISLVAEVARTKADYAKQLEQSLKKERELGLLKSRLIATASHQFRTPISIIKSNLDILSIAKDLNPKDYQEKINSSSKRIEEALTHLQTIVEDMLNLQKASGYSQDFEKTSIDVVELITTIISSHNLIQTDGREMELLVVGEERNIESNESALYHIITNLVSNSFKYSKGSKSPIFKLDFKVDSVVFEVVDFGIGIPPKDAANIGSPFYRSDNVGTIEGTGLGLSIANEFVHGMNGELTHLPNPKGGTVFKVEFPNV